MEKCKYFGTCGGCQTQHIAYDMQVANKKKHISELISATSIEWSGDLTAFSGDPAHYRNRMDFIFSPRGLSFRKQGKWDSTVPIEMCPIANKKINAILEEVNAWFATVELSTFNHKKKTGVLKYAVIRGPENTDDSSVSFVLNEDDSKLGDAVEAIKQFATKSTIPHIAITYASKDSDISIGSDFFMVKGKNTLNEVVGENTFTYSVQGFMQNNTRMSEKMIAYVRELFTHYDTKDSFLLDLYGGVGLFGVTCAPLFSGVLVAESFEGSIALAEHNAQQNNITNVSAKCHDATQLRTLKLGEYSQGKPLYVLTDPPRAGMHVKTVQTLCSWKPGVLVYVSCNPKQLARELRAFKDIYKIKSAAIFDLFPHTNHCEAVVELVFK